MKLVPVLCLIMVVMVLTACCRNRVLTQSHLWTEKQLMMAIDQDPDRQDTWIKKEIGSDLFLVVEQSGNYIKRK